MKYLLICLLLVGCASGPYDEQFCTVKVGTRCHAWVIK
jgi:hypothetical protein